LPANDCQDAPTIGFIAHLDTSPDLSGKDVKARIVRYEGGDIRLNEKLPLVLSPQDFPELKQYLGQDLIVTDGTTLLGADDKSGIAAIVSAVEYLLQHPERKHGTIRLCFTPDEEIGRGADRFDVASFAADFAYTVDGGELGSIEYENFNAANATVTFQGRNVHPGSAKHKMRNALTLAAELQALLPAGERPEYTEGYEGFYHVNQLSGSVEEATLQLLIRDHDRARFEQRKSFLAKAVALLNEKYGADSALLRCKDGYYNMREKIEPVFYVVDLACQAMQSLGIETHTTPIRGGTDGARLSFMNLPCPNLFTGGHNFHGKHEFLPVDSLLKASATVAEIICRAAELKK
jgi:tripeptide aminopeptidase